VSTCALVVCLGLSSSCPCVSIMSFIESDSCVGLVGRGDVDQLCVISHYSASADEVIEDFISQYIIYSKLNQWDAALMCEAMLLFVSGRAKMWYQHYMLTDGKKNPGDWNHLKMSLLNRFEMKEEPVQLRYELQHTRQYVDECVRDYHLRMVSLMFRVDRNMNEQSKIDYFMFGLSTQLQSRVVRSHFSDLNSLLEQIESHEQAIAIADETLRLRATFETVEIMSTLDKMIAVQSTDLQSCLREDTELSVIPYQDELNATRVIEKQNINSTFTIVVTTAADTIKNEKLVDYVVQEDNLICVENVCEEKDLTLPTASESSLVSSTTKDELLQSHSYSPVCIKKKDKFVITDSHSEEEWMFNVFWKGYGSNQDCWFPSCDLNVLVSLLMKMLMLSLALVSNFGFVSLLQSNHLLQNRDV
jgi:hypothetical protein